MKKSPEKPDRAKTRGSLALNSMTRETDSPGLIADGQTDPGDRLIVRVAVVGLDELQGRCQVGPVL